MAPENGFTEATSEKVSLEGSPEAFKAAIQFFYCGKYGDVKVDVAPSGGDNIQVVITSKQSRRSAQAGKIGRMGAQRRSASSTKTNPATTTSTTVSLLAELLHHVEIYKMGDFLMAPDLIGQATSLFTDAVTRLVDAALLRQFWTQEMSKLVIAIYDCTNFDSERHSEMRGTVIDLVVLGLSGEYSLAMDALKEARWNCPEFADDIMMRTFGEAQKKKRNRFAGYSSAVSDDELYIYDYGTY